MKDTIKKILKEETNSGVNNTYHLIVDKRTNKVMDPGLWRMGFEDSGGSSYGTWKINFDNPRSVAQYSFEDMGEVNEVIDDIKQEKEWLEDRHPPKEDGKRVSNIQSEIDYYSELLQHLEVRGFRLSVEAIKVNDPFKDLFGYSPYED
jgi:hypothetical protein